jgi:hypothetical protein
MGNNCEQIRQLLVELRYGELDEMDTAQVEGHLEQCEACRAHHAAYGAVVADLEAWEDIEPQPSRVTFVAMRGGPTVTVEPRRSWSVWSKGLAAAASFALGIFLAAAFVNMEVRSGDGAWSISTSLWPRAAQVQPSPADADGATSQPSGVEPVGGQRGVMPVTPVTSGGPRVGIAGPQGEVQQLWGPNDLDRWLEDRLRDRGFGPDGSGSRTTVALSELSPEQLAPVLDSLIAERDSRLRVLVQEVVQASEQRQRREIDDALAGVYQTFDVQRANDLLFLASELGLLQESTGEELQRTNAAIDYLITRVAQEGGEQQQERQP